MKVKRAADLRVEREKFGGVIYIPSRDDFFAVDSPVFSFLASLSPRDWSDVNPELEQQVRQLAGLQICETEPATSPEAYSGPSFIGEFEEIISLERPLVLNCFSTAHCPLKCAYCHADDLMDPVHRTGERDDEGGLNNVIAVARRVSSIVAVITGGDPLTKPRRASHLIQALSGVKALVLDTSGVAEKNVIDELLPLLLEHRVHVRVSIDFADSKAQEKLRPVNPTYIKNVSSFDSPLYLVSECLKLGIPITVQTVISNQNDRVDSLLRLRDFLISKGVRHWVLHMAVEAGLARKVEARHRQLPRARGILPKPGAMEDVWKIVKSTIEDKCPIDIRVTDNSNTPNSVLLVAADGSLYTEGLAHRGKVKLFDPEEGSPEQVDRLFYYIDKFGHARRYLNWNPYMFDGRDLNRCCLKIELPKTLDSSNIVERERKFRITDRTAIELSFKELGFKETQNAVIDDRYYDTPEQSLAPNDFVIRVRLSDNVFRLALKGPRFLRSSGEYDRIELELAKLSAPEVEAQLKQKGLLVVWRLQRRRITFRKEDTKAEIVIDELPLLGDCLEMEGDSYTLALLSGSLKGLGNQETRNYKELIAAWCAENGEDFSVVYGLAEEGLLKLNKGGAK
jgi:predicted adenylyl cyclase CyaB